MPQNPGQAIELINVIVASIAGLIGAFLNVVFGPAKTRIQSAFEIVAVILSTVIFGPIVVYRVGIEVAATVECAATYTIYAMVSAALMRFFFLLIDTLALEAENSKHHIVRWIFSLWTRVFRGPNIPPGNNPQ